ncbi:MULTISPECIES: hypothetical protein [unclassified Streptomyces]|uniref:hypothetical protein n=1 Tax=unclassified Streptomyces TaxID=2593676 RepID=UPI0033250201
MANFYQQGQNVYGTQNNGETFYVNQVDPQTVNRELATALSRVQQLPLDEGTRQQATAELEAASAAVQAGDPAQAQERIGRLQTMSNSLAEVAGAFLRGTGMLGG